MEMLCEVNDAPQHPWRRAQALLDTGCDANLISSKFVKESLGMENRIHHTRTESIVGLNGKEFFTLGEISLRFYGEERCNRCTYEATFLICEQGNLYTWELIIGRYFLEEKKILKRLALAGIHPKTKGDLPCTETLLCLISSTNDEALTRLHSIEHVSVAWHPSLFSDLSVKDGMPCKMCANRATSDEVRREEERQIQHKKNKVENGQKIREALQKDRDQASSRQNPSQQEGPRSARS